MPILMSLGQMRKLGFVLEMEPDVVYLTCPAFGYMRQPLPMSTSKHLVLDLASLRVAPPGHSSFAAMVADDSSAAIVAAETAQTSATMATSETIAEGEKDCPACAGRHRAHTCGKRRLQGVSSSSVPSSQPSRARSIPHEHTVPAMTHHDIEAHGSSAPSSSEHNPEAATLPPSRPERYQPGPSRKGGRRPEDPVVLPPSRPAHDAGTQENPVKKSVTISTLGLTDAGNPAAPSGRDGIVEDAPVLEPPAGHPEPVDEEVPVSAALERIRSKLEDRTELYKLHLKHYHMSTAQFRRRTSKLKLLERIY